MNTTEIKDVIDKFFLETSVSGVDDEITRGDMEELIEHIRNLMDSLN